MSWQLESNESEAQLDSLFAAYRKACPDCELNPDFMPELWRKIEARRKESLSWAFFARGLATLGACLCLLFAALSLTPSASNVSASYLDALAAYHSVDFPGDVDEGDLQ